MVATGSTGSSGIVLLVLLLGALVLVTAHVALGRFAFRRGKAIHSRWMSRHVWRDRTSATTERE